MAAIVTAPSFYYYNNPPELITKKELAPGQKFTTQLPRNVILIRLVATAILTASVAYAVARITGLSAWAWPVVVLGASFALYTAYRQLLRPDPLVNAMQIVAGNEEHYNLLPEWTVTPNKKLWETIGNIKWDELKHPLYRATTSDGRKVLIVRGYDFIRGRNENMELVFKPIQTVMAFVEKLGPNDIPRYPMPADARVEAALIAVPLMDLAWLENRYHKKIKSSDYSWYEMHSSITSDMMNEFIYQRKYVLQRDEILL